MRDTEPTDPAFTARIDLYQFHPTSYQDKPMNTATRSTVLAAAIALAISSFSGTVMAQDANDGNNATRLETRIATTYELNPHLRAQDIQVSVDNAGTATLTGVVGESVNKSLAEQIALGVDGIEKVENELEIREDYVARTSNGERSFGEKMDDFSIGAAVKSKLLWSTHTDGLATEVTSEAGVVTLQGTARSDISRDLAEQIALNTDGVRKVDNQLKIAPARDTAGTSGDAADTDADSALDEAGTAISDTWITSKVRSTFLYSSSLDSSEIGVETDSGVVTLSGEVASDAEQELAIELATHIRGVESVNSDALTLLAR